MAPPLTIEPSHVGEAIGVLDAALSSVKAGQAA
jgi:hypothetical protein